MLETGPTRTQPSCCGSWPYRSPFTTRRGYPERGCLGSASSSARSLPFQRTTSPAQSCPSWMIRTSTVPDCSADAAVRVAALLIAAAASSTTGVTPDESTVMNTATAAAARAAPAAERPRIRRRGRTRRTRGSSVGPEAAIRSRTSAPTASIVSASPGCARGLALCRASILSGMFRSLLRKQWSIPRGAAFRAQVLEDGSEPSPRAVEPASSRDSEAADNRADLGGRQPLPLGEQQDLPVTRAEAQQRLVDERRLRLRRFGRADGRLGGKPFLQRDVAPPRPPLIREHPAGGRVEPDPGRVALRHRVQAAPGRQEHVRRGVLRVGGRRGPPAAVGDDVGPVGGEQGVEPPAPVLAHRPLNVRHRPDRST